MLPSIRLLSPTISLPPVFTSSTLHLLRSSLQPASFAPLTSLPPHTLPALPVLPPDFDPATASTAAPLKLGPTPSSRPGHGGQKNKVAESAVLVPLMNIDGRAHVLMEVRAAKMRTHAGEASFPGGKADLTDSHLVHTALRETTEELALPSSHVEVLGMLDNPEYSLGNKSRVWAIVGFIHSLPSSASTKTSNEPNDSLPSFSLDALRTSPAEVAALLPLPLSVLADRPRLSAHYFRLDASRPYWKIRSGDLVHEDIASQRTLSGEDGSSAVGIGGGTGTIGEIREVGGRGTAAKQEVGRISPQLEVWGLSGWFLNRLAVKMGWMDAPEPYVAEGD